jgi:hypothetical protein
MSGFDPKRTSTLICAPKLTILGAISDVVTAYHCTARRFSLFIFIVSLSPSQGNAAERDFARAGNKFDETVFHLCSVFNLGRLQPPRAAAGDRANLHLTGLLHQNCSYYTD